MDYVILGWCLAMAIVCLAAAICGMAKYYDQYALPHEMTLCCAVGCMALALAIIVPAAYTRAEAFAYVIPGAFLVAGCFALLVAYREYRNSIETN